MFEAEDSCCIVDDLATHASSKVGAHSRAAIDPSARNSLFISCVAREPAGGLRLGGFPLFVLILKEINNKNQRTLFNALIKVFTSLEPAGQRGVRAGESVTR